MTVLCFLGVFLIFSQCLQKSACDESVKDKIIDELLLRVASLENAALDQAGIVHDQATIVQQQSKELQELQAEVHQLKEQRYNDLVAFSVGLGDVKDTAIGQPVKFDRVHTNTNGVYSTETGYFTAPASGHYFFSVSVLRCSVEFEKVTIRINGEQMAIIVTESENISASASAVGYLEAGQTAYIRSEDQGGNGACLYGFDHSSFSGFLVSI